MDWNPDKTPYIIVAILLLGIWFYMIKLYFY